MGLFVSGDHPLAGRKALSAEQVLRHSFVLPPKGSVTRESLDRVFAKAAGRPPRGSVETASYSMIRYLVLHANLICFRSITAFNSEMLPGRIVPLDLDFALPQRSICLLQRHRVRQTAAVNDFLEIVRQVALEFAAGENRGG
jgi:DNA-binding transcriptional LysR family regulator